MADMVCTNEGKALCLVWMLQSDGSDFQDLILRLYKNDYTPIDTSNEEDFTPATFTGSGGITIERADWDALSIVSNVAVLPLPTAPAWTCTAGGPETVYGWYLVTADSNQSVFAQRFATPRVMDVGSVETLDPFQIKLKSFA